MTSAPDGGQEEQGWSKSLASGEEPADGKSTQGGAGSPAGHSAWQRRLCHVITLLGDATHAQIAGRLTGGGSHCFVLGCATARIFQVDAALAGGAGCGLEIVDSISHETVCRTLKKTG
jgi:hypothetical protein